MNWLQTFLYGLISGLSEIVPVSASAHQSLLCKLFGQDKADSFLNALVHIAILCAVYFSCRDFINQIYREFRHNRSRRKVSSTIAYDRRFLKTYAVSLVVSLIVFQYLLGKTYSLATVCIFCLINGGVLFLSGRALQGNKSATHLSSLDAVSTGLLSGLSVLPGISRIGVGMTLPILRGADRQTALRWALLMSIPALAVLTLLDIIGMFAGMQAISFLVILGYLLAMAGAYIGTVSAISLLRFMTIRTGIYGFAFYSWGIALFSFLLYLI